MSNSLLDFLAAVSAGWLLAMLAAAAVYYSLRFADRRRHYRRCREALLCAIEAGRHV